MTEEALRDLSKTLWLLLSVLFALSIALIIWGSLLIMKPEIFEPRGSQTKIQGD